MQDVADPVLEDVLALVQQIERTIQPDSGYAVTSHSSQGQTADRVIVPIDLQRAGEQLVNQRLAYVSLSRGRDDAQVYTNYKTQLAAALDRDVSHRAALDPTAPRHHPRRRLSGLRVASSASAS